MTDIIERLRLHDDERLYREADILMSEAADEIIRLRVRNAELELKLKGEFAAGKSVFEEKERLQQRVWELEAQRVLEISEFLERLGVIAERLYNHDPRRGNLVAGDIKAIGAELIDIAQPLKAIAAAQPAQEQS